jgi:hypothetical protein
VYLPGGPALYPWSSAKIALITPPRKCHGKDEGRPCGAPVAAAFVFADGGIRPRFWCQVHAAQVREVMRSALKKGSWNEVPLQP